LDMGLKAFRVVAHMTGVQWVRTLLETNDGSGSLHIMRYDNS
jgi:hypothetical protein